jgi:hypothetical protein
MAFSQSLQISQKYQEQRKLLRGSPNPVRDRVVMDKEGFLDNVKLKQTREEGKETVRERE